MEDLGQVICEHGNYHHCFFCEHAEANHWKAVAGLMEQNAREAEARAAQLEAERDEWKARYELAFNVAKRLQDERDEARRWRETLQASLDATSEQLSTARAALAQHVTTRAELLDTIAALKRENEQLQSECESWDDRVKKLEDSDNKASRAMSEALNSGDGVYKP